MMHETTTTGPAFAATMPEDIPFNLYKPTDPLKATILENRRLTAPESPNDVRHIVISFQDSHYRYLEGQSAGIVPPGTDDKGKPHKLRLYSIASPSVGENHQPQTLTLCVKRVEYTDPETGEPRKGVCSNYLCDAKPGEVVNMAGPAGKSFLMPPMTDANMIMVATGTGIAPFRGFLQCRYDQRANEQGQAWMFFGSPYRTDYLYGEELEGYRKHPGYHLVTAFSREEHTADGRKMYVQDRIAEHGEAIIQLLRQPNTYFYVCGLRGMEKGILEALDAAAAKQGLDWKILHEQLNAEKRWHVEVY